MSIKYFLSDLKAVSGHSNPLVMFKWFLTCHTLHMTLLIRLGQSVKSIPIFGGILRLFIELVIRVLYASDISLKAKIGPGLIISHGHDIVIGADVRIGSNCKIFNGVTLGNKDVTQSSKGNQPCVGDNVLLSTGAKLLGPIKIGSYCIIGANSVVISDFPDSSLVVGIPAKAVSKA